MIPYTPDYIAEIALIEISRLQRIAMEPRMILFQLFRNTTPEALGFIPYFLNEADEDGAVLQIDKNYVHGGGWNDIKDFSVDPETGTGTYPGDPPYLPNAKARLRDETIYVYDYSFVAVVQKDGSSRVARID